MEAESEAVNQFIVNQCIVNQFMHCIVRHNNLYLVCRSQGGRGTEDTKSMVLFGMVGCLDLILKWPLRSLRFQDRS